MHRRRVCRPRIGTGVVHCAPAHGLDDFISKNGGLSNFPILNLVSETVFHEHVENFRTKIWDANRKDFEP